VSSDASNEPSTSGTVNMVAADTVDESQQTIGLTMSCDNNDEPAISGTTSRPTVTADTVERSHQALPSVRFYGCSKWLPSRYAD